MSRGRGPKMRSRSNSFKGFVCVQLDAVQVLQWGTSIMASYIFIYSSTSYPTQVPRWSQSRPWLGGGSIFCGFYGFYLFGRDYGKRHIVILALTKVDAVGSGELGGRSIERQQLESWITEGKLTCRRPSCVGRCRFPGCLHCSPQIPAFHPSQQRRWSARSRHRRRRPLPP